jgi:serine phosphatase RsbU (regulator of sigma subunit)
MRKSLLLFFLILILDFVAISQNTQDKIDSITNNYPQLKNDSLRIQALIQLTKHYNQLDTIYSVDSALANIKRSYELATIKNNYHVSNSPYIIYSQLNIKENNYDTGLEALLKYRDISRRIKNKKWEANALEKIIILFKDMDDDQRAHEYVDELKDLVNTMDRSIAKANTYNALGNFYAFIESKTDNNVDSSLYFHRKALSIRQKENDSTGLSYSYNNIGRIYVNQKNYDKALEFFLKSLSIKEKLNNIKGMAGTNINIGNLYYLTEQYEKGIPYLLKGIELSEKAGSKRFTLGGYRILYRLQKALNNFGESLDAMENVRRIESEIQNKKQIELAKELERKYNANKLQQEAKINALELENSKVTLSRQKSIIWFLSIGVLTFIVLVVLVFINYRQKKKINHQLEENNILLQQQKNKTERQNILLARKNKEITDSINYAKRIQEAILPSRYTIAENINNGFILFKPKDVVSGDFYWMEEKNSRLFLAAADCTGHGVPGAMVSVICSNALSKALLEEDIEKPGKLLDRTREIVIEQFQKSSDHVKDGMDISLAVIDKRNNQVEWSGANNPLWIIRSSENDKIEEVKADKQPVGVYEKTKPFTTHQITISEKDKLYMFSDGFVDQFGGEKNKKFKPAQLRRLLLEIQELSMKEQKSALKDAFEAWRGNNEQVDDVCIIGYEI